VKEIPMTALEKLLHPLHPADFMRQWWGRLPLHHRLGMDRVRDLFGEGCGHQSFLDELSTPGYDGRAVTATFFQGRFYGVGDERPRRFEIKPRQAETAFRAGLSVIGDLTSPAAWRLAAHLRRDLNHIGEVLIAGSLSPGGDAFHAHIDPVDSFKVQLEGSKRWFISRRPILDFPQRAAFLRQNGTLGYPGIEPESWERLEGLDPDDLEELVLEPGDVLYVPPGVVHATQAEGLSYSVDIGFAPVGPVNVLRRILEPMLESDAAWRHMPASVSRDGGLPPEVRAHLAARLRELRDAIDAVDLDGVEVNRVWKSMVANPGDKGRAALAAHRPAADEVEPESVMEVSGYAPVSHAWNGSGEDASIDVYQAATHLSVLGAGADFLRRVIEAGSFQASQATGF
jgi:ribosomal protein L16 Arg81 hydroxylase